MRMKYNVYRTLICSKELATSVLQSVNTNYSRIIKQILEVRMIMKNVLLVLTCFHMTTQETSLVLILFLFV